MIATALRRERNGVVYELMRQRRIPIYEFPEEAARAIYGLYTFAVYALALPGGWIADRLLGQRVAVLWGGTVIG